MLFTDRYFFEKISYTQHLFFACRREKRRPLLLRFAAAKTSHCHRVISLEKGGVFRKNPASGKGKTALDGAGRLRYLWLEVDQQKALTRTNH